MSNDDARVKYIEAAMAIVDERLDAAIDQEARECVIDDRTARGLHAIYRKFGIEDTSVIDELRARGAQAPQAGVLADVLKDLRVAVTSTKGRLREWFGPLVDPLPGLATALRDRGGAGLPAALLAEWSIGNAAILENGCVVLKVKRRDRTVTPMSLPVLVRVVDEQFLETLRTQDDAAIVTAQDQSECFQVCAVQPLDGQAEARVDLRAGERVGEVACCIPAGYSLYARVYEPGRHSVVQIEKDGEAVLLVSLQGRRSK